MHHSILEKVDQIAAILADTSYDHGIGLYSGKAGVALFLFYYARFKKDRAVDQKAAGMVEDLIAQIESTPQPLFSLCSGIAGAGWLVDHLCRQGFIESDSDELLSGIDEYVFRAALNDLNRGYFDFLHGAMGMALYLCKRGHQSYLRDLIQALEGIAVWDGGGAKWESMLRREEGLSGFSIALSHGSSSLALVLGKILHLMPEEERAKRLLKGAVAYMCKQEIPVQQYGCYFPTFSRESQTELYKTRLAWCYGDLGIALAIWQSGLLLGNQAWTDKGMEVLLHAANRRGLVQNRVQDAGICHGTAGLVMIFNRMFCNTKQIAFKNAADYWGAKTLEMAKFDDGLAGYKAFRTERHGGWQTESDLLEGISGIGLSLLSLVAPQAPAWDECFLLS